MKRIFAFMLAVLFVFTLIPASALATGDFTVKYVDSKTGNELLGWGVTSFTINSGDGDYTLSIAPPAGLGRTATRIALSGAFTETKDVTGSSTTFTIPEATLGGVIVATVTLKDNPTLSWSNASPSFVDGVKIGSTALSSGAEVAPNTKNIIATVLPATNGAEFDGLILSTADGDTRISKTSDTTATFEMPDKNTSISAVYTYPVTLKTSRGTVLDTKRYVYGGTDDVTLAALLPDDELEAAGATVAIDGTGKGNASATYDSLGQCVVFTPNDAQYEITLTLPVEQLYLLTTENCGIQTPADGTDRKGNYIKANTAVTVVALDTTKSSYSWTLDSVPQTPKTSSFDFTMLNAARTVAVGQTYPVTVYDEHGTPTVTYYAPNEEVEITVGNTTNFKRWEVLPASSAVAAKDLTKTTLKFTMPAEAVELTPIYEVKLVLTEGEVTSPTTNNPAKSTVNGKMTYTYTIDSGTSVTIAPRATAPSEGGEGTYQFIKWKSNTTLIDERTTKNLTFIMPPEDVNANPLWRSYTLTVRRYVDSNRIETYTLRPGAAVTLTAEEPTGGLKFDYWRHTGGATIIANNAPTVNPTTERVTVIMGNANASVTANYLPTAEKPYQESGAYIEMISEPVRYYAIGEYFRKGGMVVYYYSSKTGTGVRVDNSQLRCSVVRPDGTVVTAADGSFRTAGVFELSIEFWVGNTLMAQPIRVLNTPSTNIHVSGERPEFVGATAPHNKLNSNVYYAGENMSSIKKDGLVVNLISADKSTNAYDTYRELAANEYKLIAFNPLNSAAPYTIPSTTAIQDAFDVGQAGYRVTQDSASNDIFEMQLAIEYYDEGQLDASGQPTKMEYIATNPLNFIWIEVRTGLTGTLAVTKPMTGNAGAGAEFKTGASTTAPTYSWEIGYSTLAQSRTFDLQLGTANITATQKAGITITNEFPNIATLTEDANAPETYELIPRAIGVTTFKFYKRGSTTPDATLEVTIRGDGSTPVPMTELKSLNRSQAFPHVGDKLTLTPAVYSPNNANTTMRWTAKFNDDLQPKNVEFYVKVDENTGVVEVLKYTDREIKVTGTAVYPGPSTATLEASCLINIASVDVFSITMYPSELSIYRLASTPLTARVFPDSATDQKINWTSSNSAIVSVDNEGRITGRMLGTATITATANDDPSIYKTCKVTVSQSVLLTEIALSKTSSTLGIGDSTTLDVYYTPGTATTKNVTWESSDATVASVDKNGKVRGIAEGSALIIATANDGSGKRAACAVSVSTIVSSAVVLNKQTLAMIQDDQEPLTATVYPTNVSAKGVKWSSSNTSVALVDADGVVMGVGGGSAVITATSNDAGARYADCVVVVTPKIPVSGLALNLSSFDLLLNDTTTLVTTVSPANATERITWTSSNPAVATVDEKGKVSGLTVGSTTITAKTASKSIAITVNVVTKVYSTGTVVNCARRVNVRHDASGTAALAGYAYLGDTYKVLDRTGNWFKIQYNANTTAYIWSRYLNATETTAGYVSAGAVGSSTPAPGTTATPTPVAAKTVTITNCQNSVNVRSGAGTSNPKLGLAFLNETFTYTGTATDSTGGTWYIIEYKGAPAYVSGSFIKVN